MVFCHIHLLKFGNIMVASATLIFLIMKKDKVLELLNSQMLEIVSLITIEAIDLRTQTDKGRLNNLQRALKLNQSITKIIKDEN